MFAVSQHTGHNLSEDVISYTPQQIILYLLQYCTVVTQAFSRTPTLTKT